MMTGRQEETPWRCETDECPVAPEEPLGEDILRRWGLVN